MEINNVSTKDMAHADAIELIKAGPTVRLVVKRGVGVLPAALGKIFAVVNIYSPPMKV